MFKVELEANLKRLEEQWNVANAIKDDSKRAKYLARIESWIEQVQAALDQMAA